MPYQRKLEIDWELSEETWAEALAACNGATFFHTSAWLTAMHEVFSTRIHKAKLALPDGRWALLPISVRPLARGAVPLAVIGETGAYSGLVSPHALEDEDVDDMTAALEARYPSYRMTGNPFATCRHLPGPRTGLVAEERITHTLALGPIEALRAGFSRGCKARCNKARKQGYVVQIAADREAVEAFYPLYLDSVKRWGARLTWTRPRSFFEALVDLGGPAVRFLIARRNGEPVSALLFASHGTITHYVAGATLADHLAGCPSNLLIEQALAHFAAEGREVLDFGPSNGLVGVIQFKESFGAHATPFYAISRSTVPCQAYFALRRAADAVKGMGQILTLPSLRPTVPGAAASAHAS